MSGYLRGRRPLSANRLVHVSGWGDFQMSEITAPSDPHPLSTRRRPDQDQTMADAGETVLSRADPATQVSYRPDQDQTRIRPWQTPGRRFSAAQTPPHRSVTDQTRPGPDQTRRQGDGPQLPKVHSSNIGCLPQVIDVFVS